MSKKFDPFLLSVLSSRIDAITQDMINTVIRTARSQVLNFARDFSTALFDRYGKVIAAPHGIPIHCGNMGLMAEYLFSHPEGIHEGDLFLNNSPYHGNSHAADYTFIAPVFNDGELMFFSVIKAHQADCGNSIPTTYNAWATDVYNEGAIIFPCVKIQENYEDVFDIVNIAKMRIRVPELWYGDFLAAQGSTRTAERQLKSMCKEYGNDTIKQFCTAYTDYAERLMLEEIQKLEDKKVIHEFKFDEVPGFSDDILIHLEAWVDKEAGDIIIDVTKNIDTLAWGLNLCESTTVAACRSGVMYHMPDIPAIDGAMDHIKVIMRKGCLLGKAEHPKSYSACTTNLASRTAGNVGVLFNKLKKETGMAEPNCNVSVSQGVYSGLDYRKNNDPYVNQFILGATGGPAVKGHDGWINFCDAGNSGACKWNSVELLEQQYPVLIVQEEIIPDTIGSGQWDSAPGVVFECAAREAPYTATYACDGGKNAPKGIAGGLDGHVNRAFRYKLAEGRESRVPRPVYSSEVLEPGDVMVGECCVAGGYGNPLDRDPEMVCLRVREGWITEDYAKQTYGVVLDTSQELFKVKENETKELREQMRNAG
ncbi:MAG: hydantoinase B/oxoprolinase family protein [Christensenellaceae bacterium]|jgi:N-methylhydantoinase B